MLLWTDSALCQEQSWFPKDYQEARSQFRKTTSQMALTDSRVQFGPLKVPSQVDDDLTIDYVFLPAHKIANTLLILTSGVHGVEAFTGSALQNLFLTSLLADIPRDELSILLIHSINPYGFKYLRRVSENNVDLNRNFSADTALFGSANPGYRDLEKVLNPQQPLALNSLRHYWSILDIIWRIVRYSIKPLRQAVLQGQYEFPYGLYFGGNKPEPQTEILRNLISKFSPGPKRVMLVDIHTGYGAKGKLHLFGSSGLNPQTTNALKHVFSDYPIDTGNDKDFYSINGEMPNFIGTLLNPDVLFLPMTFEFGTLDSQTMLGSLKSIRNMIAENQGHHHGYATDKDRSAVQKRIAEMYYPDDPLWQNAVVTQTRDLLPKAVKRLLEK